MPPYFLFLIFFCFSTCFDKPKASDSASIDVLGVSQDLLLACKTNDWVIADSLWQQLNLCKVQTLGEQLSTDEHKKSFWLNIYNATVQYQLKQHADLYENRSRFYSTPLAHIARQSLSLDDIEHGILRRSKVKLSLGYLNRWFVGRFERQMRVSQVDARIHFALNCGAKSCPAIAYYTPQDIEAQLELSTKVYLMNECTLMPNNVLQIPVLFSWFRADFGGKDGTYSFLQRYQILNPDAPKPDLVYKDYNWDLELDKYR